jgi:hypothetical protein
MWILAFLRQLAEKFPVISKLAGLELMDAFDEPLHLSLLNCSKVKLLNRRG